MGRYFSLDELCSSDTAKELCIDNIPSQYAVENIEALIEHVLDPAREEIGMPIKVESGFRSEELNIAVSGAVNSQHKKGQAADLIVLPRSQEENERLGRIIATQGNFDQLIFENVRSKDDLRCQWIHVSYKDAMNNRGEILCKIIGKKGYHKVTIK